MEKTCCPKSVLVSSCWYTSRTKVLVEVNHLVCPQNPSTSFEKIWKNTPDSNKIIHTNSRMFRQHHVPSKCVFDRPVFNSWLCKRWIQTHEALAVGFLFFCKKACTLLAATGASFSALIFQYDLPSDNPILSLLNSMKKLYSKSMTSALNHHEMFIPWRAACLQALFPGLILNVKVRGLPGNSCEPRKVRKRLVSTWENI